MSKFKVNENTLVDIDNAAGSVISFEEYCDEIEGVGEAFDMLDVTVLSDPAPTFIKGIEEARSLIIRGSYDNTASFADEVLRGLVVYTTARTVSVKPDGTRLVTFEGFCKRYDYIIANKGVVRYEAEFIPSGGVTIT